MLHHAPCIAALPHGPHPRHLSVNLNRLSNEVKSMRHADAARLQDEYNRLVAGLEQVGGNHNSDDIAGAPVLPADVLAEAVPGNIRNAELFVRFMKHVVRHLRERIKVAAVVCETPTRFLLDMGTSLGIDPKPLRFAYSRLSSLLRTLQVGFRVECCTIAWRYLDV